MTKQHTYFRCYDCEYASPVDCEACKASRPNVCCDNEQQPEPTTLEVGTKLPNGGLVVACSPLHLLTDDNGPRHSLVIAHRGSEYVVWHVSLADGSAFWGKYYLSLSDAVRTYDAKLAQAAIG